MIDKLSTQHRIIIATIISFAFFVAYDYFFIPKNTDVASSAKVEQKSAPSIEFENKSAQQVSSSAVAPSKADGASYIVTVKSEKFELKIDSLGRIAKYYLNDPRYQDSNGDRIQLIDSDFGPKPLEIRFKDRELNEAAFANSYTSSVENLTVEGEAKSITLSQNLGEFTITKEIKFEPSGNYIVDISLSNPTEYFVTPGFRPNVIADRFTFHGVLIKEADDTKTVIDDGDLKVSERFLDAPLIAAVDRYYTTLIYNFDGGFDVIVDGDRDKNPILFAKGTQNMQFGGYIGPKEYETLFLINPKLTDAIEYGWFTFIAKPLFLLLKMIHKGVGNWGWSIVIMTILIRLVLYPLTYKGMVSMSKLKELSPKIKELQAKYKGEPQKLNAQMMDLYKKHGANPMGGCLPIILQIPIFFAIYRVLSNAIELKSAPWIFWVQDLAAMDPYFVLPILMGLTMFLQQRITPANFTDPMQEKIMKFLPLIFTFFFISFPAGLTLYWFINNLFSIGQQYYVNKLFEKRKQEQTVEKGNKK